MASSVFFGASSDDIWGEQQRHGDTPPDAAAQRRCSRPTCNGAARFTLAFDYAEQRATLTQLITDLTPELYDLCEAHADRTSPPRGWRLNDERFTPASQRRIFADEADALATLIDDMRRGPKKRH